MTFRILSDESFALSIKLNTLFKPKIKGELNYTCNNRQSCPFTCRHFKHTVSPEAQKCEPKYGPVLPGDESHVGTLMNFLGFITGT